MQPRPSGRSAASRRCALTARTTTSAVLALPVTRRDGEVTCESAGQRPASQCIVCTGSAQRGRRRRARRAGALMLTEAALVEARHAACDRRAEQPAGVVGRAGGGADPRDRRAAHGRRCASSNALGNVTVLDRPVSTRSMISAVQSALRDRRKQYRIRDQLDAAGAGRAGAHARPTSARTSSSPRWRTSCATRWRRSAPGCTSSRRCRAADDKAQRLHEIMERQMGQMVKLIDELLEVSRISTGKVVLQQGAGRHARGGRHWRSKAASR